MNKAKYTSRKQGPNGKWEYTYASDKGASGAPKTKLGLTSLAAKHAAKAAGHEFDAENHAAAGNHGAAETSRQKAEGHREKQKQYASMASFSSGPGSSKNERMMSASEREHATRASGGDKRMATAGEAGRFAIKHPASSPWDTNKSLQGENFMLSLKKGIDHLSKAPGDRGGRVMVKRMKTVGKSMTSSDMPGSTFGQSADGIDLLRQMISSYEHANFGSTQPVEMTMVSDGDKALDDADAKNKQEASSVAQESDKVDTRGNAPHLPVDNKPVTEHEESGGDEPVAKSLGSPAVPMMIGQAQIDAQAALLSFFASQKAPAIAYSSGKVF